MKKWKMKIALSVLTLSLVLPLSVKATGNFSDVGPRFEDEIDYLVSLGVAKGYTNGTFGVNKPVTRAEAVTMIVRELPIRLDGAADPGFTDFKKGDGFYTEVAEAVELGIIQGKVSKDGSRYFDPNGSLSRGEMATILTRAYDIPLDRMDVKYYKDVSADLSTKKAISALTNGGISFGYGDATFRPYSSITRQQFAAMLARTINKDFNPMYMQFVHIDEVTHQRVKTVWLTEQELNEMEEEMFQLINRVRVNKGFTALKFNELLLEYANLKAREYARYPYEDYNRNVDLYEVLSGEKLYGKYSERSASGSVEFAFRHVSTKSINETHIFEANQKEIGIGLAQKMDGTITWMFNFFYK